MNTEPSLDHSCQIMGDLPLHRKAECHSVAVVHDPDNGHSLPSWIPGLIRIQPVQGKHGWGGWRVCLGRRGIQYCVDFMETQYGGDEQARSAALAFHAALLARLPKTISQWGEDGLPGTVRRSNTRHTWRAYLLVGTESRTNLFRWQIRRRSSAAPGNRSACGLAQRERNGPACPTAV